MNSAVWRRELAADVCLFAHECEQKLRASGKRADALSYNEWCDQFHRWQQARNTNGRKRYRAR